MQARFVGKIFELVEAGERVALERAFRLFRAAGSKGETGRAIERSQRTGAPHISHGEHGRRATHVSVFPEIRSANQQRQHGREHAGSQRDRADPGDSYAVHLRLSQPGALAKMAACTFSGLDRRNSSRVAKPQSAPGSPTRSDDVNGVATTIRKMTAAGA